MLLVQRQRETGPQIEKTRIGRPGGAETFGQLDVARLDREVHDAELVTAARVHPRFVLQKQLHPRLTAPFSGSVEW
jgi:hypothetical protein